MGTVLFVSHQWLSFQSPDPNFEQFSILIRALKNLMAGKIVPKAEPIYRVMKGTSGALSQEELTGFKNGYMWYDSFSVPQLIMDEETEIEFTARRTTMTGAKSMASFTSNMWQQKTTSESVARCHSDHRHGEAPPPPGMIEAISSLPSYVQRAHFFVILIPVCKHVDLGHDCDLLSTRHLSLETRTWLQPYWMLLQIQTSK